MFIDWTVDVNLRVRVRSTRLVSKGERENTLVNVDEINAVFRTFGYKLAPVEE